MNAGVPSALPTLAGLAGSEHHGSDDRRGTLGVRGEAAGRRADRGCSHVWLDREDGPQQHRPAALRNQCTSRHHHRCRAERGQGQAHQPSPPRCSRLQQDHPRWSMPVVGRGRYRGVACQHGVSVRIGPRRDGRSCRLRRCRLTGPPSRRRFLQMTRAGYRHVRSDHAQRARRAAPAVVRCSPRRVCPQVQ